MSIAVSIKVSDGFAIAADSATTLTSGEEVVNIYNSANKIVNLVKGKPIGLMFWDSGQIGSSSLSTIAKDFRQELASGASDFNHEDYSMEEIANRVRKYFYEDRYKTEYPADGSIDKFPSLGMYVCGFGTRDDIGRAYTITIDKDGACPDPVEQSPGQAYDFAAFASPDPIYRLVLGISAKAKDVMIDDLDMSPERATEVFDKLTQKLYSGFLTPAMPIIDALELAEFLVQTTVMYYRFKPGHATVGGPIEVAAITKHEGFKWVSRKHFYRSELNP